MKMYGIEQAYITLSLSAENAQALIQAIYELGQMDSAVDYDLFIDPVKLKEPENWNAYKTISDILRTHKTVSTLCEVLSDELKKIEQAAELLDSTISNIKKGGE